MHRSWPFIILGILFVAFSAFAQVEWTIPLSIYVDPGTTKALTAHTSIYGSDMFDSTVHVGMDSFVVDKGHPPPPPSGFYAFFPLDDPAYSYIWGLTLDGRSAYDDTIVWTVWWGGAGLDSVYLEWDPGHLPTGGEMLVAVPIVGTDADWSAATDMSTTSVIAGHGALNWFQFRYTAIIPEVDSMPPYFTNWVPPNGSTDIPETTTIMSVDILDDMSPIDTSTIDLTIAGMEVPHMPPFYTVTEIAGGVRLSLTTGGMISLPPCSTIISTISAADTASNVGYDTSSFTVACTVTTFGCVAGTVQIGGTDWSGSLVQMGAYHDTTDASGYYHICAPLGSYMLRTYHDCYYPDSASVTLTDSFYTQNFTLVPSCGTISGSVELDGAIDWSGTTVMETGSGTSAITDASGNYTLPDIPLGSVEVVASQTGYIPDTASFTLIADTSTVDFILFEVPVFYTVNGNITLEGETDHSGTQVIFGDGLSYQDTIITGLTGSYSFTSVPTGIYNLSASQTGFEDYDTVVNVTGNVTINRELEIELPPGYNPPSNVQATKRPCWTDFNIVTWDPPMMGDTVKLAHCSARGYGHTTWGGFSMYYGYGWTGGGYAMPFVAPEDSMKLSRVRLALHPYSFGITTEINVWAEDPDSGGPGASIYSGTVTLDDTSGGWAYIDLPDVTVGTDPFFVGWIDQFDSPDIAYVMYDYTSPDTLAWIHYSYDSSWQWEGENVDMADGDFAIECYVSGGPSTAIERSLAPSREALNKTKIRRSRGLDNPARNFTPTTLEGSSIDLADARVESARSRPAEMPTAYRLYRHSAPFTDTTVATFIGEFADTIPYYLDMDDIDGNIWYYGMTAVYSGGVSGISELAIGYNEAPPDPNKILLIDWGGGWVIEDDLGWEWDPSDSLTALLTAAGISADSIYTTNEHQRLYGIDFTHGDTLLWDMVMISWNPLSSTGWLGPRLRGPEWRKLYAYLTEGGRIYIEGADAAQLIEGIGSGDSLWNLLGVNLLDNGINSLDTGNVRTLDCIAPLFVPDIHLDYSMGSICDYGNDEIEHSMGSGAMNVMTSQLIGPMPHASNGRAVWNASPICTTYIQSVYMGGMIDLPGATNEMVVEAIMDAFLHTDIPETKAELPGKIALFSNIPNPFNAATEIVFELKEPALVDLSIYDIVGREIKTLRSGQSKEGIYKVTWDGRDDSGLMVGSGIYFYKLTTEAGSITKRMLLLK